MQTINKHTPAHQRYNSQSTVFVNEPATTNQRIAETPLTDTKGILEKCKKANKSMDCVNLKLLENKSATVTTSPSNHRSTTNQSQLLRRNQADNTCSHNKNPGTRQCRCFGDVLFRCCELQVKQWSHTLWSLILEHSVSVTLV